MSKIFIYEQILLTKSSCKMCKKDLESNNLQRKLASVDVNKKELEEE